jgi:hypothetical protein
LAPRWGLMVCGSLRRLEGQDRVLLLGRGAHAPQKRSCKQKSLRTSWKSWTLGASAVAALWRPWAHRDPSRSASATGARQQRYWLPLASILRVGLLLLVPGEVQLLEKLKPALSFQGMHRVLSMPQGHQRRSAAQNALPAAVTCGYRRGVSLSWLLPTCALLGTCLLLCEQRSA